MKTCFEEVLARESASLAQVADAPMLAGWRRRVVKELMTPHSPYALALRQTSDAREHADFLDRWRELIADTVNRLQQSGASGDALYAVAKVDTEAGRGQKTAVLILAALYGGSILSQLAGDPRPLNAALDLALVPLVATGGDGDPRRGTR